MARAWTGRPSARKKSFVFVDENPHFIDGNWVVHGQTCLQYFSNGGDVDENRHLFMRNRSHMGSFEYIQIGSDVDEFFFARRGLPVSNEKARKGPKRRKDKEKLTIP